MSNRWSGDGVGDDPASAAADLLMGDVVRCGAAHDVNNILQEIVAGIEMAQRRVIAGQTEAAVRFLVAARESAERASLLTDRLVQSGRAPAAANMPAMPGSLRGG